MPGVFPHAFPIRCFSYTGIFQRHLTGRHPKPFRWLSPADCQGELPRRLFQDTGKFFIRNVRVNTGARFTDGLQIDRIQEYRRVQRPLGASPRSCLMYTAAIPIKYAVALHRLHLDTAVLHPPVPCRCFLFSQPQKRRHPLSIVLIQGYGGLPLTAEPASPALKYIVVIHFPFQPNQMVIKKRMTPPGGSGVTRSFGVKFQALPTRSPKTDMSIPYSIAAARHFSSSGTSKMT